MSPALGSWITVFLLGTGLALGATSAAIPERPVEKRLGLRVLQVDLHAHTRFSDGVLSPFDLVHLANRRALDAVAITEHNAVWPALLASWYQSFVPGAPVVIIGEEVTTRSYHLTAFGHRHAVDARAPIEEVIAQVHAQGGVVVAAHPTKLFWPGLAKGCSKLDGSEVVHPLVFRSSSPIGSWEEMIQFYRQQCAPPSREKPLAAIASSDFHFGASLGTLRTFVFIEGEPSEANVVSAIREGRTVAVDPKGKAYGPPELVAALELAPLAPRDIDAGNRLRGSADLVGRVAGFLGLLGLLVFGLPRRSPT